MSDSFKRYLSPGTAQDGAGDYRSVLAAVGPEDDLSGRRDS